MRAAATIAATHHVPVILNPAPAQPLDDPLLRLISVLTPNESEAELLTGVRVTDEAAASRAADVLRARGVRQVIVTLGSRGAWVSAAEFRGWCRRSPSRRSTRRPPATSSTAALAVALSERQITRAERPIRERRGRPVRHEARCSALGTAASRNRVDVGVPMSRGVDVPPVRPYHSLPSLMAGRELHGC